MPTSHFDRSVLPPARSFYERELGELRKRDRKGWASPKAGCPFHASESKKSFFVNVDNGGFHCFGCDAKGGDVLAFVRQRYSLSFREAKQQLGINEHPTPEQVRKLEHARQEQAHSRVVEAVRKESQRQERITVRDSLHALERLYLTAQAEHDFDLMADLLPPVREADAEYRRLCGLEECYV